MTQKDKGDEEKQDEKGQEKSSELDFFLDAAMMDLFRIELETQTAKLSNALISFENNPHDLKEIEELMRAAHSIKGAAKILHLESIIHLAHAMEDCFSAAQNENFILEPGNIDLILNAVDLLKRLSKVTDMQISSWLEQEHSTIEALVQQLIDPLKDEGVKEETSYLEKKKTGTSLAPILLASKKGLSEQNRV